MTFFHLSRHIRAAAVGVAILLSLAETGRAQSPQPVYDQLSPDNSVLLLIDFQPQYTFSTRSLPIDAIVSNAEALAKAARVFKVPTIVTTITAKAFAGPLLADLQAVNPDLQPIDVATVTVVDRVLDAASGTFGVRLALPNPRLTLPGGIRCQVTFVTHPAGDAAALVAGDAPSKPQN